jgi:anaerobic magnesium-protoporphyrin IX monomethyl ester cyclase
MRVLFVYPSIDTPVGFNHGLAAMSGVLKAQGHETRLIHVNEGLGPIPTPDEVLATVRDYAPGVIGFSCMSQQYPWASEVARHLRASGVEAPIVVGGVHCTMVPDEVVEDDWWDGVFVGECDDAFAEYVRRLEAGEDVSTTANLRMKRDGAVIRNAVGAFPDLKTIAPKDYELFDVAKILDVKKGWVSILTSRGCPYKCTYCFNKEIVDLYKEEGGVKSPKEYLRHYDVDRIVGELLDLKRRYPGQLRTVIFDDDLFTLNKGYVLDFCRAYKEAGVDLPFVVNAHVQVFNDDIAFALKEAGCRIVKYGLESGSDRLRREVLWRFMPNKKIVDAFAAAHRYDLHTSAFIMAGLPTETKEEIEETLQLCADIGMGRFRWAIFYPFPRHRRLHDQQGPRPDRLREGQGHGELLRRLLPQARAGDGPLPREDHRLLPLVRQRANGLGQPRGLRAARRRPRGDGPRGLGEAPSRAAAPRPRAQRAPHCRGRPPLLPSVQPRHGRALRLREVGAGEDAGGGEAPADDLHAGLIRPADL